jgi:hypothetical protein
LYCPRHADPDCDHADTISHANESGSRHPDRDNSRAVTDLDASVRGYSYSDSHNSGGTICHAHAISTSDGEADTQPQQEKASVGGQTRPAQAIQTPSILHSEKLLASTRTCH